MAYHHLTQEERYQIYAFRKAGFTIRAIADELGRSPSTISRELQRNVNRRGYRPQLAHRLARQRAHYTRRRLRIKQHQWRGIGRLLKLQWSPQQIAERCGQEGTLQISHTWIYRFVAEDRATGGQLWRQLRRSTLRRKHYHTKGKRHRSIRFRVGIEHRPRSVESRVELGHWERDTIIGRGRRGSVLIVVERKSRYLRMGVLANNQARTVARTMRYRLHQISARVHSITLDNGKEFACHPRMSRSLSTDIYFAEPYKPWQRGSNENTNGLIRQYLPKKMSLDNLTQKELDTIERRLNHRPRKCLGYLTPHEVFNNTRDQLTVALRS
jgi:IS30 family transposase